MANYGNDPRNRLYNPIRAVATTQGQTSFNLNYAVGTTLFFKNGAMLDPQNDYTANNGSTITLTNGCNVGDVVWGISLAQFNAIRNTYTVTETPASSGQTSFTILGGYTPGFVEVFLNGSLLASSDFTATDGVHVVLNTAASSGDLFRAHSFGTFNVANAVQKSGDTMSGALVLASGSTVPTPTLTDSSTALANTSFVNNIIRSKIESLSASVSSNALTVTLTATVLDFRANNQASGSVTPHVQVPQLSITIPSGATLGTVSGQTSRLLFLVAYNAGTPVLCVTNLAGGLNVDETLLINPTAISSSATSNNVIYSATGVTANSPFRVVGFADVNEATAGTWVTAPTLVQGAGGLSTAALGSLGVGQTWQNVTSSRALSTTYYNTTGRSIVANVETGGSVAAASISATVNGVTVNGAVFNSSGGGGCAMSVIVPINASYSFAGAGGLSAWQELR